MLVRRAWFGQVFVHSTSFPDGPVHCCTIRPRRPGLPGVRLDRDTLWRDRSFVGVELAGGRLAVRIDERLLVDPPDTLDSADVVGVLRAQIAGMLGFYLSLGLLSVSVAPQSLHVAFVSS